MKMVEKKKIQKSNLTTKVSYEVGIYDSYEMVHVRSVIVLNAHSTRAFEWNSHFLQKSMIQE